MDSFRSLDGTKDVPYTNSMMWNCIAAVRSFFRTNSYNKPKKDELLQLYKATRNPRDRALLTFKCSSTIARENLTHLTWGHLEEEWKRTFPV